MSNVKLDGGLVIRQVVMDVAENIFGSEAIDWLGKPNRALGSPLTPKEYIRETGNDVEVLNILERIEKDIVEVDAYACKVLGEKEAKNWLAVPCAFLDGCSPRDFLLNNVGEGRNVIKKLGEDALGRLSDEVLEYASKALGESAAQTWFTSPFEQLDYQVPEEYLRAKGKEGRDEIIEKFNEEHGEGDAA